MNLPRRILAGIVLVSLAVLVVCDVSIRSFRLWWNSHSLTGDIASSLLVVAVTGLVIDEVVAHRQRRERSVSVAVQALIVYGQARRATDAAASILRDAGTPGPEDTRVAQARDLARDEMRILASMLLTSSSNLFDDPDARVFLERVQRLAGDVYGVLAGYASSDPSEPSAGSAGTSGDSRARQLLESQMKEVDSALAPLVSRIPGRLLAVDDAVEESLS